MSSSTKPRQRFQDKHPEVAALVKKLCRSMSLDAVARVLAEQGHLNRKGKRFNACAVYRMLDP
jgi:hypothetical protein